MDLILLRHGIAEDRAATDADRALTPEGAEKIARVSRGIRSMLKAGAKICIWTSPLRRALETAQIVSGCLNINKIEQVDALATGEDLKPLLSGWIAKKSADVLIVVGHQPYLTELAARLTGVPLPFKKGAAAGYSLGARPALGASLRWFVQPGAWPDLSE